MVKSLPAVWETWVWSLGREDPLEKEMATHSSILAWKIPWTEELSIGATVHGVTKSQAWLSDFTSTFFYMIVKCLESKAMLLALYNDYNSVNV